MLTTKIYWTLHDYCKAECSYCPKRFWGGEISADITQYMKVTKLLIDNYAKMNRKIEWFFDGGEPLELFDLPMMLKYCKDNLGTIHLNSNGGRLWLDWWAIEPNIDTINLSYHYWQNSKLIEFIAQTFLKKQKSIQITVPIRPSHFQEDFTRLNDIQQKFGSCVSPGILFKEASHTGGPFGYSDEQLLALGRPDLIVEKNVFETTTFKDRMDLQHDINPKYFGKLCNEGIDIIRIGGQGWVSGSSCGNTIFGNIWDEQWTPPSQPSICQKMACIHPEDHTITKFL